MEQSKIDIFMATNGEKLPMEKMDFIVERLKALPDDKFPVISYVDLKEPGTMLVISLLTGWDRFFLDDVGMGILKLITCNGLYIWWIVDLTTVKERVREYNFKLLSRYLV